MQPSRKALDADAFVESAERDLLVDGKEEFLFPIRKKSGFTNFYQSLEEELRNQDLFTVAQYRVVKEGWAKVSRPAVLRLDIEALRKHRPHLRALEREMARWREEFAPISADRVIRNHYKEIVYNPGVSRACFEVFLYLVRHRDEVVGLLPRQIQHGNSTKLIGREPILLHIFEEWRSEPASWISFFRYFGLVEGSPEFRFFAPRCSYQNSRLLDFHGILARDWHQHYAFEGLSGTLIVENFETFRSEAAQSIDQLIVWGCGWKASLLRVIEGRFPRPIRYWGDIDKEGYEIYGHLKEFIPDLTSALMGAATIEKHLPFSVAKDPFYGPFRVVPGLQDEYQSVCRQGLCIEQEKIHDRPY